MRNGNAREKPGNKAMAAFILLDFGIIISTMQYSILSYLLANHAAQVACEIEGRLLLPLGCIGLCTNHAATRAPVTEPH